VPKAQLGLDKASLNYIFRFMKNRLVRLASLWVVLLAILSTVPGFARVQHLKIPSLALADSNRVIVSTPVDFDAARSGGYPFIVMLHGWSGDENQWAADADLQVLSDQYDLLLILPDGGYDGWWLDTDRLLGRNYATHIHEELTIWVVERFNGSLEASQHGILGLSMGGFGAIYQALKFPRDYAAAASLSGVMDLTRHQKSWGISQALGPFEANQSVWQANNPLNLAQKPAPLHSPAILLICGRDDITFAENQALAHQFSLMDYPGSLQEEAGAHTHTFWKAHVNEAVAFIVKHFSN